MMSAAGLARMADLWEPGEVREALWELVGILRLLDRLEVGDRLVVGLNDDGAFACVDLAPPVDRGPLVEATTPREALAGLARR
jgi:hypothetical protein